MAALQSLLWAFAVYAFICWPVFAALTWWALKRVRAS